MGSRVRALSAEGSGKFGSITDRAEPTVLRLSMIYALADKSLTIRAEHLRAALALWAYCRESARYLFANPANDPKAKKLMQALKSKGLSGLSRTDINNLFDRHLSKAEIDALLATFKESGLAYCETKETPGRSIELWFLGSKKKAGARGENLS